MDSLFQCERDIEFDYRYSVRAWAEWLEANANNRIRCKEIRVHVLGEWRIIYVAKLHEAIYVLHAFQKKTRRTGKQEIDLARQRYKQIGG